MARSYNRSTISSHLASYELTMKEFAEWCGMTESGLSRTLRKECEEGFSNIWQWAVKGFLFEKGKGGFELKHDIFD